MTSSRTHTEAPVRVALVGLGGHGRTIQEAAAQTAALDIAAVYDPNEVEASLASERFGCSHAASYDALFGRDDLDAVVLASPNFVHRAQAEAAFAAGLDVFVEKPIANTVADGRAMVEAAEQAGRILMVGHNMRFAPAARRLRALLDEDALGRPVSVEVHFASDTALRLPAASWRLRPDQCPLLPMMQLGIHGVDLVHYLLGPITQVYAQARAVTTAKGVVDSVVASFSLADGVLGTLVSNYCTPVRFAYYVAGTEGAAAGTPHTLAVHFRVGEEGATHDFSQTPFASYAAQLAVFARSVRTRERPESDGRSGLHALAVVEAMQASIDQQAPVEVAAVYPQPLSPPHPA